MVPLRKSNDHGDLLPRTGFPESPALRFDWPALKIGVGEYEEGPTGCTLFLFDKQACAAVDIRGGSYGTLYTNQLLSGDRWINGICLAGGSFYGLESAMGAAAELMAQRNYSGQWDDIARISGAVIYDLIPRDNLIYPDKALGRAAARSARPGWFPLGARGAGCSATVGKVLGHQWEHSGQGAAFAQVGAVKIAVFTVVNAVGAIVNRQGEVVRGFIDPATGRRHSMMDLARLQNPPPPRGETAEGNTTLTVVATNQTLSAFELRRLAKQTHTSMARAIQPFHTAFDGDVLYAVTTNEVSESAPDMMALPLLASELAWDAVLACLQ